jgi:hypothetical protein
MFDHLPKTAGQAVNSWLSSTLGNGCVTDNLIGKHRELISSYGGTFSVISGHILFDPEEGLDPRYQYVTLVREPVDRVISWLYFVTKNHTQDQLGSLFISCLEFLDSEGSMLSEELIPAISNLYVNHFSNIISTSEAEEEVRLNNALSALKMYDVIGTYEDISRFTNDLGAFIGVPAPEKLEQVNATAWRPATAEVSPNLRDRIAKLNHLDLQFYSEVKKLLAAVPARMAPTSQLWSSLPQRSPRIKNCEALMVNEISMRSPANVQDGDVITFVLDIQLNRHVDKFEAGIHIFDDQGRWAFGVNNDMLDINYTNVMPGRYRVLHHLVARLPTGSFTAGFSFSDISGKRRSELFWHDAACSFAVTSSQQHPGVGYSICPARQSLVPSGRGN